MKDSTAYKATIEGVFFFYHDRLKPLYTEITAFGNELPIELLFEIHAAFDHIRRFYVDNEAEEQASSKAYSHLKRASLDAYKLKLKKFHCDYDFFLKKHSKKIHIIDSGNFGVELYALHAKIIKTAKAARLQEAESDVDKAFEHWDNTSELINDFYNLFFETQKTTWAANQLQQFSRKTIILSAIASSLLGMAIEYFFGLANYIINFM